MSKIYIGIDPGKYGGIFTIFPDNTYNKFVTPLVGDKINGREISKNLVDIISTHNSEVMVVIEDVHSIFGTSAKSNFQFGMSVGIIHGIVDALSIPYTLVGPKKWQAICYQGIPENKDKKIMSAIAAHRLFPEESFIATARSKKPHDGLTDAALIAYYGKVKNL